MELEQLWVKKYNPNTLDEMVLDAEVKKVIKAYIDKKTMTNLLLAGRAGIGKTSLATVIVKELDATHMYLNASVENGVDVIRYKVREFCNSVAIGGGIKLVILDEADGMCLDAETEIEIILDKEKKTLKLKDLDKNKVYQLESFNFQTQNVENDYCYVTCDKEKESFEVELENGEKIICTAEHKFFNGNGDEVRLNELKAGDEILSR